MFREFVVNPTTPTPLELFVNPAAYPELCPTERILMDAKGQPNQLEYFHHELSRYLNDNAVKRAEEIWHMARALGSIYLVDQVTLDFREPIENGHTLLSERESLNWHNGLPVWFFPFAIPDMRVREKSGEIKPENVRRNTFRVEIQNAVKIQVNRLYNLVIDRPTLITNNLLYSDYSTVDEIINRSLQAMNSAFNNRTELDEFSDATFHAAYANSSAVMKAQYGGVTVHNLRREMKQEASLINNRSLTELFIKELRQLDNMVQLWLDAVDQESHRNSRVKHVEKHLKGKNDLDARPYMRQPIREGLLNDTPRQRLDRPNLQSITRIFYTTGLSESAWIYPSMRYAQPLFRAASCAGFLARHTGHIYLDDYRPCGGLLALATNRGNPGHTTGIPEDMLEPQTSLYNWIKADRFHPIELGNIAMEVLFDCEPKEITHPYFKRKYFVCD